MLCCFITHEITSSPQESSGTSPLHEAARGGWPQIARMLVDNGALVDVADSGGETPLHWACRNGYDAKTLACLLLPMLGIDRKQIFDR